MLTFWCLFLGFVCSPAPVPDPDIVALNALTIEVEHQGDYNRREWGNWRSGVNPHLRWKQPDCKLAFYGTNLDPAQCTSNSVDRDHLVAVKEAFDSGAHSWPRDRKRDYYNYLPNLYVLNARENRGPKSGNDPTGWQPTNGRCRYAREWVVVKAEWKLSIDQAEYDALKSMLDEC